MLQIRTSALLFDMDGTLVDSTELVESTWASFSERHGLNLNEVLAYAHGRPTRDTVGHFLADTDLAAAETQQIVSYEESETTGIVEVPGAAALLNSLPSNSWAIVTSASRKLAVARLGAAGVPIPTTMVCAEDVEKTKPHPEGFIRAAELLGVQPNDAIAFEDSPAGVRAALDSKARTIVVGTLNRYDDVAERYLDFRGIRFNLEDSTQSEIVLDLPAPITEVALRR